MTDAELDHLEAIFRNPPSNGVLAEHGLRLIEELRRMRKPITYIGLPVADPTEAEVAHALGLSPPRDEAAEMEPLRKAMAVSKKKGGKHG